ncbi:MAG: Mrp/NBP35 family ATP-binding protein [Dehalococcoidia bacterium]|nr:Mrp/NBP35 family ATP-binding protein [Chloroflexota bacterium]MCZ6865962.1 Mrp/NBP35 family ATP-binding protein [Chloroflexota bacterium]
MTTPQRTPTPQEQARLDAIKKTWQQRRAITQNLSRIKAKVAVYSGKGGVGKTTVAVNLATILAQQGNAVGLLDVDIDCPNVTKVLGMTEPPQHVNGKLIPSERFGIKVVSMGFFQQKEDEAIIWRGPMVHNAINQFLQLTDWGDLDYLVVDLPPGTSDSPLTVMQTLPLEGFIMVTTPQMLAQLDAKRSINMVQKLNVKVLGVVENYTGDIFGKGAGEALAKELGIPFLGSMALRSDYRDESKPTVLSSSKVRKEYEHLVKGLKTSLETIVKAEKDS